MSNNPSDDFSRAIHASIEAFTESLIYPGSTEKVFSVEKLDTFKTNCFDAIKESFHQEFEREFPEENEKFFQWKQLIPTESTPNGNGML